MVSESFRSPSQSNNNNIEALEPRDTKIVCGVLLIDERTPQAAAGPRKESDLKNCLLLGSLVLEGDSYSGDELRRLISSQLTAVPTSFAFMSKEGWPLVRSQETKLTASNIIHEANYIAIRKLFDKPRLGILNTSGDRIGFIFADYVTSLKRLRETVDELLKEVEHKLLKSEYRFIERSGWPVASSQEEVLSVLDILVNQNICIQNKGNIESSAVTFQETARYALPSAENALVSISQTTKSITNEGNDATDFGWRRRSKKSNLARQTTKRRGDKGVRIKAKSSAKPIMLSYARQEAAQHALDLKVELAKLGFSVYLDIHEIQTGTDWQDALNDAVSNCHVFVPLVTPMYGKTQWTNREVKLADLLKKLIVPINFNESWPPECLAIQFATTQYIGWRPTESEHEPIDKGPVDIKMWSQIYIKRVAKLIAIQVPSNSRPQSTGNVQSICDKETNQSLVVISAHPKQKGLADQVKKSLEEDGYEVWSSTDLSNCEVSLDEATIDSVPNSPTNLLPTITEDQEAAISDAYKAIARRMVESKQRPLSLPPIETHAADNRKPLTRMMSQVSELDNYCSLPPEKMERLQTFQDKVSCSGVVVVIVSEAYYTSRTSQQHIYYCEHRKKVVVVRSDLSPSPSWFSMLMGQEDPVCARSGRYLEMIKARVKRVLDPSTSKILCDDLHETKIQYLVSFMEKNLPYLGTCVYIVGSSKLQNPRSEAICKAIGVAIAEVKNVTVVTSGFYGAGDIVARSFQEARENTKNVPEIQGPGNPGTGSSLSSVRHILPLRDASQNFSDKCKQNLDGSFEPLAYGETMFLGESVKERETAVARLLDTCILIEGGPGTAHEVEEFIWNDHFVIPVISTGGAASGQFGVPLKIFESPTGVAERDWRMLSNKDATPVEVAKAVVRIVVAVKQGIAVHALSSLEKTGKGHPNKFKARLRRSSKNKVTDKLDVAVAATVGMTKDPNEASPQKILPVVEAIKLSQEKEKEGKSRWKRMQRIITFSKGC